MVGPHGCATKHYGHLVYTGAVVVARSIGHPVILRLNVGGTRRKQPELAVFVENQKARPLGAATSWIDSVVRSMWAAEMLLPLGCIGLPCVGTIRGFDHVAPMPVISIGNLEVEEQAKPDRASGV